ncbi:MAG: leucine-rich repeat domain-containing protein [Paludibacteraceae bacterium]|nr:leucine-rich repeat domain-containing protein [Paludibacteraceae bacterium]
MNLGLKKTVISLVMLFASTLAMPLFAQQPTLPKNTNGYYIIKSDADYETFRQIVATGNPYANAVLEADITVVNPIGEGDEQFHYRGTFDGRCHTVTFGKNATGLFEYTKPGCVIRNLKVTGCLITSGNAGSIVNDATGTVLRNCISDAAVLSDIRGGLVGIARGVCFIENCAFIGELAGGKSPRSGLVGTNSQSVNIKSCYVAPDFGQYKETFSVPNLFTDKMEYYEEEVDGDTQIIYHTSLNNYYTYRYVDHQFFNNIDKVLLQPVLYATEINDEDLSSGKLCYMLNKNGRKGVVWYQNGKYPYPFKVEGSKLITSTDSGETFRDDIAECSHEFENQICAMCGALESKNTEPLQNRQFTSIDNIDYEFFNDGTAAVKGLVSRAVKAVHIPETINFKGEDFVVTRIESYALVNSDIEYCFIPRTVTRTGANTFMGCKKLKYLHIADALPNSTSSIKLYPTTFEDCALEKIYVGKDVKWDIDGAYGSVPFKDKTSITDIYWGPHVAHIASEVEAPRLGNYELFEGCTGVQRVYFMGNDNSLGKDLAVLCGAGMSNAKELYINRNIKGLIDENGSIDYDGLYNGKEKVVYGPYVKSITDNTFKRSASLKTVDFSHAYNLETIGPAAFLDCDKLNISLDFSTTNLKNLGQGTFAGSAVTSVVFNEQIQTIPQGSFSECKNLTNIRVPSSVTSIGFEAFYGCENLKSVYFEDGELPLSIDQGQFVLSNLNTLYIGRNIEEGDFTTLNPKSVGIITIGPKVTNLYKGIFDRYSCEAFIFENSDKPLHFDDYFAGGTAILVLNRDIVCDKDNKLALPFTDKGKTNSVSFGDKMTKVYDSMFDGYNELSYVLLPSAITEVGSNSFRNCKKLAIASIIGEPNVKDSAFIGCEKLKYLYFMGNSVQLAKNVFKDCPIEEVTTNFNVDPENDSAEDAFDGKTYSSAQLINAKDIEFTSNPWVKFNSIRPSGTNISENAASGENFDKASIHHKFPEGEFDMVYLPFDMDSYYFGVDAEIYRLDITDEDYGYYIQDFNTPSDRKYAFSTNDINFVKVDIDNEKRLSKGNVYFIKVKHEEESMAAYFSFFESNGIKVVSKKNLLPKDNLTVSRFKADEWALTQDFTNDMDYNYYVFSEGVLKRINGEYHPERATALLLGGKKGMDKAFNLNGGDETITSSVTDVTFSEKLKGYSSFYAADYNYIAPEWMDVYIVKGDDESTINLEQVEDRTITKGEAVLLKSGNDVNVEGGIAEHLTYATHGSSASYEGNLLKGVNEDTPADQLSSEGFVYALNCNQAGENTGFYKLSGDETMPTGKAYLDPSDFDPQQVANDCLFVCDGSSTDVKYAPVGDREQDGRMQGIYDLMGRRLKEAGFKGVYVVNGKKVIIK